MTNKKTISATIDLKIHKTLQQMRRDENLNVSAFVEKAIKEKLERDELKEGAE